MRVEGGEEGEGGDVFSEWREVVMPEEDCSLWPGDNYEFDSSILRYGYSSFVTPKLVVDLQLDLLTTSVRKRQEVPGYKQDSYQCSRTFATSSDGHTQIPISIVYRKNTTLSNQPLLLYGISHQ